MHPMSQPIRGSKLKFEGEELISERRIDQPMLEKIIQRCPRLAAALSAVGAAVAPPSRADNRGELAAMMSVNGSIDYAGRQRNSFRFHLRPIC